MTIIKIKFWVLLFIFVCLLFMLFQFDNLYILFMNKFMNKMFFILQAKCDANASWDRNSFCIIIKYYFNFRKSIIMQGLKIQCYCIWHNIYIPFLVNPVRFERTTHWLKASCSANWAKGSKFLFHRAAPTTRTRCDTPRNRQ